MTKGDVKALVAILVFTTALLLLTMAYGQPARNCAPSLALRSNLAQRFDEHRRYAGIINERTIMEVYISEDETTWSVVYTYPNLVSCMMASGQSWVEVEPEQSPVR